MVSSSPAQVDVESISGHTLIASAGYRSDLDPSVYSICVLVTGASWYTILVAISSPVNMPLVASTGPVPASDQYRPGTGTLWHVYRETCVNERHWQLLGN